LTLLSHRFRFRRPDRVIDINPDQQTILINFLTTANYQKVKFSTSPLYWTMKLILHTQTFIGTCKNNFSAHIELYGSAGCRDKCVGKFVPVVLNK